MDEFLQQFLIESRELVAQASDDLLALETAPRDTERFDNAFRAFHTLKGGAGIVDFAAMETAMHSAETVLTRARKESGNVSTQDVGACLEYLDLVVGWLDRIEDTGALPPAIAAASVGDQALRGEPVPLDGVTRPLDHERDEPFVEVLKAQLALLAATDEAPDEARIASAGRVAVNALRHEGDSSAADALARVAAAAATERAPRRLQEAIVEVLERRPGGTPRNGHAGAAVRPPADAVAQTLRVSAERVDALVKLTGELTVAKNAIGHAVQIAERDAVELAAVLRSRHAALDRLTGELQRAVLAIRVVPLRAAFRRLPRLVRELSAELGKPATLVLEGEDTEADKTVVEALAEPLVHLLRNSMDHGVEGSAERAAAGKGDVANIVVRASRQRDHVLVEISDDGRGVDVARVRQVAAQRNMLSPQALAAMTDAEVMNLVFTPGFSTAGNVTELSGRGIGMDAVRAGVARVGGRVELHSTAGAGTTVRIVVPFSVMMTQVMTVEAVGQRFAIPLDAVVETLRVPADSIFTVGAAHAIVLRDETVPLVRLTQMLGHGASMNGTEPAAVVVADVDGALGAFQVDRIGERMDIMLAPLEGLLAGLPGLAGSTLLGDGSVMLVLDLPELLR